MKVIASKRVVKLSAVTVGFIVLLVVLLSFAASFIDIRVITTSANLNKYEVRSKLLMEAMNNLGVNTPENAALLWSSGLKVRNAAMQYAVMTEELKAEYSVELENSFPNWITGMSSPWIESYRIIEAIKHSNDMYEFDVKFFTQTSTGPESEYNAKITVIKENDFWRISKLNTDKELNAYTGFSS